MRIKSKIKDYSLEFVDNILSKNSSFFSGLKYNNLFYFLDKQVYEIYTRKIKKFIGSNFLLTIVAIEKNKSYSRLGNCYNALIKRGFRKTDVLVTIGGGILQDISGFIASTMYRGIKWVFFPTTLLAQADSCIGSKTSINFDNAKNLIGTFYPPDYIYIDTGFCDTLANEYFNSGLCEIIKFHLMSNEDKYELLKKYLSSPNLRKSKYFKQIIASTLEIKKSYFQADEFDIGRRNLLNYGHCFGHALESASNFTICHGEAVMVGMGFANLLSLKRKIMTKRKFLEFESIFQKYYPRLDLSKIDISKLISFLKRDKKRGRGKLTMILSEDIGKQYKYDDITESEVRSVYQDFLKVYPKF